MRLGFLQIISPVGAGHNRNVSQGLAGLFFLWALYRFLLRLLSTFPQATSQESFASHNVLSEMRVLYIVTSLTAYDTGRRSTTQGDDRWAHTLVPVVGQSASSLADQFKHVDLCLIANYTITTIQRQMLQDALPLSVGLHIWNEATPYGYASEDSDTPSSERHLTHITRALARQHRYVIKDNIEGYDLFVNFEDDMLVHGCQAQAYVDWTQRLYDLRQTAPISVSPSSAYVPTERFYGPMTKIMLSRMLPGFIRVEHSPKKPPNQHHQFQQIPVTLTWPDDKKGNWLRSSRAVTIDPIPCCQMRERTTHIPALVPKVEELFFWETRINALGIRQLPGENGDWVLLQTGNEELTMNDLNNMAIGDFWTGRPGYFEDPRPVRSEGDFMNNQGGWMATKRQILEWHRIWCNGSFLPPYEESVFGGDGLDKQTVEFWSGGFQIAGALACNLQRIIPLAPDQFAHFLLYHTSNNKQSQKHVRHRFYGRNIQDFWGQLNTVRLEAERNKINKGGS